MDKGPWTDPYTTEMLPGLTFYVADEYGDDVVFDDLYEPTECQILKTYKTHQALLEDNCEGIHRVIHLYEGPVSDPYRDLILDWKYDKIVLFTDIYTAEVIPAVTVDVPDDYGPDYTFGAMYEPEVCLVVLEHAFSLDLDNDCEGWLVTPSASDGGVWDGSILSGPWTVDYVIESFLVTGKFVWSDEYEASTSMLVEEPAYCQETHETEAWSGSDCFEYWGGYILNDEIVETFRGSWLDPYGPESITVTVVVPIPEGELGENEFEVMVAKDAECIQCKVRVAYYQAMVRPTSGDVPLDYMSLPFKKGPFCAVITPKGSVPAEHRITSVCSLCPEVYPDGFVSVGSATEADVAAVYRIECYGEGVKYVWFGKDWTKWGKIYDPMYTTLGRKPSCPRIDYCNDWIMENAPGGIYPELEE